MNTITPGAARVIDAQANSQVITDALALQYAAPLPFGDPDFQLLAGIALAWELSDSPTRSRRARQLARHFADALAGIVPFSFTLCDVADVYVAVHSCASLDDRDRRRVWSLASRMQRALTPYAVGDVVSDLLATPYVITAEGRAALAEPIVHPEG